MWVISMQNIAFVATCVTSGEIDAGFCVARDVSVVHIRDGGEALWLLKKKFSMTEEELCNESIQRKTSAQRCPHVAERSHVGQLGPKSVLLVRSHLPVAKMKHNQKEEAKDVKPGADVALDTHGDI